MDNVNCRLSNRYFYGGRRFSAVLWADFVLFIIAMAGSIVAAIVAVKLPEVGGLSGLFSNPEVASRMSFFRTSAMSAVITL